MKKQVEELREFLNERFGRNFFDEVNPENDTELLSLLPDNQDMVRYLLRIAINDEGADYRTRYAAARYMLEYFASPFDIKTLLNRTLEELTASRSERLVPIQQKMLELFQKLQQEDPGWEKDERPLEDRLLEDIGRLAHYNPRYLKRWAWEVEGVKLTCSIGDEKLF